MATTAQRASSTDDPILSPEESWDVFDQEVRRLMGGMSGDEFVRRWQSGDLKEIADQPGKRFIMRLALLMPVGCS